jgi:hypothetical protein
MAITSASMDVAVRTKAAWLLKDLCNPVAVRPLVQALVSSPSHPELHEQILDTLERFAFAGAVTLAAPASINAGLRSSRELELFGSLLATLGTDEALALLRKKFREETFSPFVLSGLESSPRPWVDAFLETAAAENDHDGRIGAASSVVGIAACVSRSR